MDRRKLENVYSIYHIEFILTNMHLMSLFREMMKLGSSQHWSKTLKILTGKEYITAKPLLDYYEPIYKWLKQYVQLYNIPVGW